MGGNQRQGGRQQHQVVIQREWRHQQTHPFDLLRIEDTVEDLVEVFDRDQLALRDIAQIGPRGQVDRRRKFREKMIRQIEIEVKTCQIPTFLLDFVDVEFRE